MSTSQAPLTERVVPYLLLAEFDIDEGSVLRHEYPSPTGTDQHLLAELMLPDGVHSRSEDWTVFFLNQSTLKPQATAAAAAAAPASAAGAVGPPVTMNEADQPLLHVLNLVRTKKDDTVRRGAVVKSLAICTPKPYIQIYKPLLLLALDDYYANPSEEVLANLYDSLNAMDLSAFPTLSRAERFVLRFSDFTDLFDEKFLEPPVLKNNTSRSFDNSSSHTSAVPVLNRSRSSTPAPERKASVGSFDSSGAASDMARVGKRSPRDTHFFDSLVTYSGLSLPVRIPTALETEEVGDYSIINLCQTFSAAGNHSFPAPHHPHLHSAGALTPPIILLLNALLTNKRIIFLGTTVPAHTVAQHVLAACALGSGGGSGVLRGFVERAFPSSNLFNRDNHESVPGYIAGVANPRFEAFTQSWDVFCNIDTGKITVSKDLKIPNGVVIAPNIIGSPTEEVPQSPIVGSEDSDSLKSPSSTGPSVGIGMGYPAALKDKELRDSVDVLFMDEIMANITAHAGESAVRARFADYVVRFTRLASKYEEEHLGNTTIGWPTIAFKSSTTGLGSGLVSPGDLSKEMNAFAPRIEAWRQSRSYQYFRTDFREAMDASTLPQFDLGYQINRLRLSRNVSSAEVETIFGVLAERVQTEAQVTELLSFLPSHIGGFLPLGFGFFHPSPLVRESTVELFQRIESHPTGGKLMRSINNFHKRAYARLVPEMRALRVEREQLGGGLPGAL